MFIILSEVPYFSVPGVIGGNQVVNDFSLDQYINEKYVVLFFYPRNFKNPDELIAFQEKLGEFEMRDTVVVGCSTETEEAHLAWLNTPRVNGGIQGITYPLLADLDKTVATNFNILGGEYDYDSEGYLVFNGNANPLSATFIFDKDGIMYHVEVNKSPLGRDINHILDLIDSLRNSEGKENL